VEKATQVDSTSLRKSLCRLPVLYSAATLFYNLKPGNFLKLNRDGSHSVPALLKQKGQTRTVRRAEKWRAIARDESSLAGGTGD